MAYVPQCPQDWHTQEMIVKRYGQGMDIASVAFKFNCRISDVFRILRANGARV